MDRLQKALLKLSAKELSVIKSIFIKLSTGQLTGFNIQKLKGHKDIFRIRKGGLRIIYREMDSKIMILTVERRSEKTYRNF